MPWHRQRAGARPVRDGALVVISVSLVVNHAADFMQAGEDIRVQHVGAVGAVEVFDIGFWVGLPGWMCSSSMPWCWAHCFRAALMNFGPLCPEGRLRGPVEAAWAPHAVPPVHPLHESPALRAGWYGSRSAATLG